MGINIGIGLVLSFSYILFSTVTSSFAVSGLTTPFIAMGIPNVIYLAIGLFLDVGGELRCGESFLVVHGN